MRFTLAFACLQCLAAGFGLKCAGLPQICDLKKQLADAEEACSGLVTKLADSAARAKAANAEAERLAQEVDHCEGEIERLRAELEAAVKDHDSAETSVAKLKKELGDARDHLEQLANQLAAANARLRDTIRQLEDETKRREKLEIEKTKAMAALEAAERANEALREQLKAKQRGALERDSILCKEADELQKKANALREELRAKEGSLNQALQTLQQREAEAVESQKGLLAAERQQEAQAEGFAKAKRDALASLTRAAARARSIQAELEEKKAQLEADIGEARGLQDDAAKQAKLVQQLEAQLEKAR